MRPFHALFAAVVLVVLGAGCGKKESISLQRKEAATLVSEAESAVTLRGYARAEGLLVKALGLGPDWGDQWISLGTTSVRLGKRDEARKAYKRAQVAVEDEAVRVKNDARPALQQVTALALLGRHDEARARLQQIVARFPSDPIVYAGSKQFDRLLAGPGFKEVAF